MSVRVAAAAGAPVFLALGCVGFLASPALAEETDLLAAAQTDVRQPGDRDIVVTGERGRQRLESPKSTSDLLDTPQTVTVISDQVLRRQNLLTLRDALAPLPAITSGAGEGGGGYGDAINLRGYSASNDITQDGVRDSAQYSRTDPFNLRQIEVYNGANSVFNGSGSVGGTINLVAKVPQPDDLTILSAAVGTDDYFRATIDTNRRLDALIAVRLNAVYHRNHVPGRDFEENERWGVAPAITFGIGGPTSLTLAFVHQRDDNVPVYGIPYFRNLSRWQSVRQNSTTSSAEGVFCLTGTGRQPVPADAAATVGLACPAGLAPGFYPPSRPRGRIPDQENRLVHTA